MSSTTLSATAAHATSVSVTSRASTLGLSLVVAAGIQAVANLAFHATVSRQLDPAGYGTVATLLATVLLLTVPLGSLQVAFATARRDSHTADPRPLMRRVLLWSSVVGVAVVAAAPMVASFLHLPSAGLAMLLAPCLVLGALAACLRGLALGEGRVGRVAASIVVSSAVRVAFGLVAAQHLGVAGALWATIAAELAGVIAIGVPSVTGDDEMRLGWRHLTRNASVVLGLWLFTGIDALLARHYLGVEGAAGYLSAGTLTRAGLALPLALVMANIAAFTDDDVVAARRTLIRVATVVAAWGALTAIAFAVVGGRFQQLLFGDQFAPTGLLVVLAVVAGLSGLVTTFTYFLLAQQRPAAQLPWLAAIVEIVLIGLWHDTPVQVAAGSGVSLVVALVVMGAAVARTTTVVEADAPMPLLLDDLLWRAAEPALELSVVVPFYNPGDSVGRMLESMVGLLRSANVGFEVIAVSDGSTDGSEEHVLAVGAAEVRLIVLPQNQGKGGALMRGFSAARGSYVSFIDADGDIDPAHLVGYVDRIREGGDMVYACKRHEHSISASSSLRKLISIGFSTYTSMLFRLGVADTQTGCKVMRRELMADVLPHMHERRFAFDLELFVVAKRRGHDDLRPAPVELGERLAGSTVTSKAVVRTLKDSLTIWKRLYLQGLYPAATEFVPASLSEDLGHLQAVA